MSKVKKDGQLPKTSVLNSAAFQDHFMRQTKLIEPIQMPSFLKNPNLMAKKPVRDYRKNPVKSAIDTGLASLKTKDDGKGENHSQDKEYVLDHIPSATLAEKLGIVSQDPTKMSISEAEWKNTKERAAQRNDFKGTCSICMQDLGVREHVLLSCSHVFHRSCIKSFENFSGKKTCPMCRTMHYQSRLVHDAKMPYKIKCATRIQSHWRGYVTRKWYKILRKTHPPKDPRLRKIFYEERMSEINDRMIASHQQVVDDFYAELNQSLLQSRKVFREFDEKTARFKPTEDFEINWFELKGKALLREDCQCSICLVSLWESTGGNDCSAGDHLTLLSCSHTFHSSCLTSFENFTNAAALVPYGEPIKQAPHNCPVCRAQYQRIGWSEI